MLLLLLGVIVSMVGGEKKGQKLLFALIKTQSACSPSVLQRTATSKRERVIKAAVKYRFLFIYLFFLRRPGTSAKVTASEDVAARLTVCLQTYTPSLNSLPQALHLHILSGRDSARVSSRPPVSRQGNKSAEITLGGRGISHLRSGTLCCVLAWDTKSRTARLGWGGGVRIEQGFVLVAVLSVERLTKLGEKVALNKVVLERMSREAHKVTMNFYL